MRMHHGSGVVNISWNQGSDLRRVEILGLHPKHSKEAHLRSHIIFEDVGEDSIECSWKAGNSEADQELDSVDLRDLAAQFLRMADRLDGKPLKDPEANDPIMNDFMSVFDPKE